ncbi:hypothetical protein, partial [Salmonella sp. SAL4457]|uniref:hypothetical protein n=1 Tax=Salmonella sp. SAL4457 TaxID=3159912 RepID=UPI00397AA713
TDRCLHQQAIDRALQITGTIANPKQHAHALAAIASEMAQRPELIERALDITNTIRDPGWQAVGLATIAKVSERRELIERAI